MYFESILATPSLGENKEILLSPAFKAFLICKPINSMFIQVETEDASYTNHWFLGDRFPMIA